MSNDYDSFELVPPKPKKSGTIPNGYAAQPGTGPKNETCGSCHHAFCLKYSRNYWKCELQRRAWTNGTATDIRLKSPACSKWRAKSRHNHEGEI